MADTDLLFSDGRNPSDSPVEIVFGDDDGLPPGSVELRAAGRITGLRGYVAVRTVVRATAVGRITGLRGYVAVRYDINVERPVVGSVRVGWQQASRLHAATVLRTEQGQQLRAGVEQAWQDARGIAAALQVRWELASRLARVARVAWQESVRLATVPALQRLEDAARLRVGSCQGFQEAVPRSAAAMQGFQEALRLRLVAVQRMQDAAHVGASVRSGFRHARPLSQAWALRYEEARPPVAGITPPPQPPKPDPCYVPQVPVHLAFDQAVDSGLPAHLVFVCDRHSDPEPGGTIVVPVRRVYIVLNSITLRRVESGAELHAHSMSMSLDYQSWTWTWSASLHYDSAAHLGRDSAGDPAELEAVVNGMPFRLRLERLVEDRRFLPQLRWAVSGKGTAMILGAPYAPTRTFSSSAASTAQQLAADALTVNGVGIGWALDWQIVDWLVPAGAWSVQGTPIDAINDIAAAAGGYVQPHATDPVLRVLPRYPAASWAWGSVVPDYEIPGSAAEVVGIEHVDKPAYDRVFVGGVGAGVFGPFKRSGTAGTTLAPPVNHALITHADVHRARGIAELSDTGRQEHVSLRMQVLPDTGVIVPGQFVRYVGDRTVVGIVRRTAIDWSWPTLRQTLEVETHAA
ncbi:hypothetical protein QRO08_03820 [Paracidovorax citrulli]|uniref:Uncharacterized protein n=2 Tax=Paracidovorax citrulli TaxID=80869 RepID=A1TR64_PARC0|nr:hypothetical protein [Paracidovorax citrulli]ABM33452.1 conserved hypothetical protein [Paracidovorax citrulli AAC00-1]ABM34634.1 conserved hypothetical protein [Paracidovorax citrulli AAC00-1]ATG92639.1 hypothetical protein CQB05_00065 [Paracidovorax citrulli]ATG94076.1 hypothetical protein CQB05_08585 [Paracidovorax citrulli]PVY62748.1 hypothetical protein C8E08_0009 [Paracidovorax citrulli]